MSEWMPIEAAPKDGTSILAYGWEGQAHGVTILFWSEGHERSDYGRPCSWAGWAYCDFSQELITDWQPTHWMPLPAPPVEVKEDEQGT